LKGGVRKTELAALHLFVIRPDLEGAPTGVDIIEALCHIDIGTGRSLQVKLEIHKAHANSHALRFLSAEFHSARHFFAADSFFSKFLNAHRKSVRSGNSPVRKWKKMRNKTQCN